MTDYVSLLDRQIVGPQDVLAAHDTFQAMIRDAGYVRQLLRRYFEFAASDLVRYPAELSGSNLSLLPIEHPRPYGLTASYHEPDKLATMTSHTAYVLLSPLNRAVEIDLYEAPLGWRNEVFDAGLRIARVGHLSLQPGRIVAVRPESTMLHFQFQGPTVFIKIHSQPVSPYEWSFDLESGRAWQSIAAVPADSNAFHACILARAFADERLNKGLRHALSHKRHQIRWAAAQALGRLGRRHGIEAMQELADDAHPEVSAAARQILAVTALETAK